MATTLPKNAALVCWDLETTGCAGLSIHDENNRIVQIAARTIDGSETFEQLVNPQCHIPIPSSNIHKLVDADVQEAPSFDRVLPQFKLWCERVAQGRPLVLIAHNGVGFDWPVLLREARRVGKLAWLPTPEAHVCTLTAARITWPHLKSFNLAALYESLSGTALHGAHNAAADVGACAYIWQQLLASETLVLTTVPKTTLDSTRILEIKWIGPRTATDFVALLNRDDYDFRRLGHVITVSDLRRHFAGWSPAEIESTLRSLPCRSLREEKRILPILSAILNRDPSEVAARMPFITYDYGPFEALFPVKMRRRLCEAGVRTPCGLYRAFLLQFDTADRMIEFLVSIGLEDRNGFRTCWESFVASLKS